MLLYDAFQLIESDLIPINAQISLLQTQCNSALTSRKYVLCTIDQIDDLQTDINAIQQMVQQMISDLLTEIGAAIRSPSPPSPPDINYDLDAAADVLAAVYPHQDPLEVLREQGFINGMCVCLQNYIIITLFLDIDSTELLLPDRGDMVDASSTAALVSPIPEDPTIAKMLMVGDESDDDDDESVEDDEQQRYVQRRSRWRRVLRTALPLQVLVNVAADSRI